MISRLLTIFFVVALAVSLFSCSEEVTYQSEEDQTQSRITTLIKDFYNSIHLETRVSDTKLKIKSISSASYSINNPSENLTKSSDATESFEIHNVSVDFGESSGYVILSDTPDIDRVFYYTENGCLSDTATIQPLKEMIEYFPVLAESILTHRVQDCQPKTRTTFQFGPIVRFTWNQGYPYNNYGSYCTCDKCAKEENHKPIGCVAVAVGQTIATMRKFKGTFYGNKDIDFFSYPNHFEKGVHSGSIALSIAHFMQEIALNCQTKFTCNGSSASIYAANNYLHDLGYNSNLVKGELDIERFKRNLKNGHPHIMCGTSNVDGHTWVADGFREVDGEIHIHNNWGQGYDMSLGWCIGNYYLDTKEKVDYYKSHAQLYID